MFKLAIISSLVLLSSFNVYAQEKEQIEVWEEPSKSFAITKAIADFEAINDCEIKLREISSAKQLDVLKEHIINGERIPDVMVTISDKFGEAQEDHLLMPLDFMTIDRKDYLDEAVGAFTESGKIYAAPRSIETLVVYYNKALLEYPYEFMDDYLKFNDKMLSEGKYGLIGKLDQFYIAYGIFSGYGAYVFGNKNGKYNVEDIGLNNDGAVKALEFIKSYSKYLPKAVLTGDGWAAVDTYFKEGKAAAVINGPWALGDYAKSGVDYGVAPLPILKNGQAMRPFYGAKGYVVSADSKNKELAEKFLEYINRPEYALIRYSEIAELPPIKAVLENPLITNDDFANAIAIQIKNADAMPTVPEFSKVWDPMGNAILKSISGEEEPKNALNKAVYEIKDNE